MTELHPPSSGPDALPPAFRDEEGALEPDGSEPPARDPMAGVYYPTTRPGGRLPHVWLEKDGTRRGAHDFLLPGRFLLICGESGWRKAAAATAGALGVAIETVVIGAEGEWRDIEGGWSQVREIGDDGAVLVRPDGHAAWRAKARPADPAQAIETAMRRILRRDKTS